MRDAGRPPPDEIYRALQKRIDELPVAFPETTSGVELRLLRALFTEREAEIALALSAVAEPVEVIRKRLLRDRRVAHVRGRADGAGAGVPGTRELTRMLAGLAKKGAVNGGLSRVGRRRVPIFGLAPLVVGMFEFQVDRLTPEYVHDFHQYLDEGFRSAIAGRRTTQLRTVPVRVGIASQRAVAPYDDIRSYLERHPGPFSVINCVCRQAAALLGRQCTTSSTHETCLMIGSVVQHGREIDHAEILSILDRAEREGHVLQPQNSRRPSFICCCCRDCCEVLQNARKLPRPADAVAATYVAVVSEERCTSCGRCVKRCPMGAIRLHPGAGKPVARVDEARCIGCGLCASACPEEAVTLARRKRRARTPRSNTGMYLRMYRERRGVAGVVAVAFRRLFGLRI